MTKSKLRRAADVLAPAPVSGMSRGLGGIFVVDSFALFEARSSWVVALELTPGGGGFSSGGKLVTSMKADMVA